MSKNIGHLWGQEKNNKRYFTGHIEISKEDLKDYIRSEEDFKIPIVVFKNQQKKNENSPDLNILLRDKK